MELRKFKERREKHSLPKMQEKNLSASKEKETDKLLNLTSKSIDVLDEFIEEEERNNSLMFSFTQDDFNNPDDQNQSFNGFNSPNDDNSLSQRLKTIREELSNIHKKIAEEKEIENSISSFSESESVCLDRPRTRRQYKLRRKDINEYLPHDVK